MDRTAARMIVRRVLLAMIQQQRTASLPTGTLLVGLDMLARAQFLEGLAGRAFNSVSAPAGSSKGAALKVIKKLLLILDPTINVDSPDLDKWTSTEGASGLYKAAWLGANKVLTRSTVKRPKELWKGTAPGAAVKIDPKTWSRPPSSKKAADVGMALEPGDILTANMLRYIDPAGEPKLSEDELAEMADTASMEEKLEVLEGQEGAIKEEALAEAANSGNFFWMAGKKAQQQKDNILSGDVTIDRLGGIVARYAANSTANVVAKMATEARKFAEALRVQALPGADEDRVDFDLGELPPQGWGYIIQAVLADPTSDFSAQVFNWMKDDLQVTNLTDRQKMVMDAYFDAVIDGRLTDLKTDAGFVEDFNRRNPDAKTSPADLANIKSQYFGTATFSGAKGGNTPVVKRLMQDAPQWKLDAEDMLFLMNAQQGRGKFASQRRTAADRALRSTLIRLAHEQPALRPHLLPLLKQAGEDGVTSGRTWGDSKLIGGGTGNPKAPADDKNPPYNKRNLGPGGCNKEDDDGECYKQRLEYNKRYREEVCRKEKHKTNCGM